MPTLYALKGEIVRRGVKAVTGLDMPVFPKRRFQHGATPVEHDARAARRRSERDYRRAFERAVLRDAVTRLSGSGTPTRDRFVLDRRGPRPAHDPWRHQGVHRRRRARGGRRPRSHRDGAS